MEGGGNINSIVISGDSNFILSGTGNILRMWDRVSGICLRTFEGIKENTVKSLALSCWISAITVQEHPRDSVAK